MYHSTLTKSRTMTLSSPAFMNNYSIPERFTCDGLDVNPPLQIMDIPAETRSLVLILDDPDALSDNWTHWLVWNISPDTEMIEEGRLPGGAVEGVTSFGTTGYGGPCPPNGEHRYFFKLYALDTKLNLPPHTEKEELLDAMTGHVVDRAQIVGLYERKEF